MITEMPLKNIDSLCYFVIMIDYEIHNQICILHGSYLCYNHMNVIIVAY